MNDVDPLVAAFCLVSLIWTILFWLVRGRVASTGIPLKYFTPEMRRVIRFYRELAPSKGWSLWPIAGW